MAKRFVFVNQKGGVGKTTSVINIGAYMALSGKRVLLLDFDSQGNMTSGVGLSRKRPTIYEVLSGMCSAHDAMRATAVKNLFAITASINLSGAAIELVNQTNREFYLKNAIKSIEDSFDYILIDCPPSLGVLTLNGLAAADEVLIPMQCEYFALEGIALLMQTIRRVRESINTELGVGGIFFTMYDSRLRLARDIVLQVKSYFKDRVFNTLIPRSVRLAEAPSHGKPICLYEPRCPAAESYKALADEVMSRG